MATMGYSYGLINYIIMARMNKLNYTNTNSKQIWSGKIGKWLIIIIK